MRHEAPRPASSALPLHQVHASADLLPELPLGLDGCAVAEFNDLLHELHPDAPHVEAEDVASVARWLLSLPTVQAEAMLEARLGRLQELRDLAGDTDWGLDEALSNRISRLLDYVARSRDLIPDDVPLIGRLDDALLVELSWPMLADELEDFRDFCRFRDASGAAYGGHPSREQWLAARLEEGALWEQVHRVRSQHYIDPGPLPDRLRVV